MILIRMSGDRVFSRQYKLRVLFDQSAHKALIINQRKLNKDDIVFFPHRNLFRHSDTVAEVLAEENRTRYYIYVSLLCSSRHSRRWWMDDLYIYIPFCFFAIIQYVAFNSNNPDKTELDNCRVNIIIEIKPFERSQLTHAYTSLYNCTYRTLFYSSICKIIDWDI